MHLHHEQTLPLDVTAAGRLLSDADFVAHRASATGARVDDALVTGSPDSSFTVTVRRSVPSDQIPAQARAFVGDRLEIRQVEAWEPQSGDRRTGTVVLEITGTPVRLTGTLLLEASPDGAVLRYDGELKASVPLFGAAIEKSAAEQIVRTITLEKDATAAWIERHNLGES